MKTAEQHANKNGWYPHKSLIELMESYAKEHAIDFAVETFAVQGIQKEKDIRSGVTKFYAQWRKALQK